MAAACEEVVIVVPVKKEKVDKTQMYTFTFGERVENHAKMQMLGEIAETGFSCADLAKAAQKFTALDYSTVTYVLHNPTTPADSDSESEEEQKELPEAEVLVVRNGVQALLGSAAKVQQFYREAAALEADKQAFMYGRVVNKNARWNLCFADFTQEADFAKKKGTVVNFKDVPLLAEIRAALPQFLGEKAQALLCELNHYYDIKRTYINWHGDAERRRVAGIRLGASQPLHFQWFHEGKPVGRKIDIPLDHGDLYVMSEKAVGTDWKRKKIPTLRHATGAAKFLKLKK